MTNNSRAKQATPDDLYEHHSVPAKKPDTLFNVLFAGVALSMAAILTSPITLPAIDSSMRDGAIHDVNNYFKYELPYRKAQFIEGYSRGAEGKSLPDCYISDAAGNMTQRDPEVCQFPDLLLGRKLGQVFSAKHAGQQSAATGDTPMIKVQGAALKETPTP